MRHKWNQVAIAMLFADLLLKAASPQSSRTIEDGVFTISDFLEPFNAPLIPVCLTLTGTENAGHASFSMTYNTVGTA